jgi:hypothetical protein
MAPINDSNIDQCKEDFGEAYVKAVAAAAGCWVQWFSRDYDGVDGQITRYGHEGTFPDNPLRFQLKTTHAAVTVDDGLRYELPVKNYDKLRVRRGPSAVLIVVVVPESPSDWISQDDTQLIMTRAGYWRSLYGAAETTNRASIAVTMPTAQLFDVAALDRLMALVVEDQFP